MSKLQDALDTITKQFGAGTAHILGASPTTPAPPVALTSSGSTALDKALGGGYPRGRIVELYGPEDAGKSTLALHALRAVHAAGGAAAHIDVGHTLDTDMARRIGVDLGKLLVSQPDNGEQALEIVEALARSGAVDLIVIDPLAALVPKAAVEGDAITDEYTGLQARLMSHALRRFTAVAFRTSTCVLFVNDLRPATLPHPTTGGNALKFYASVRVDVRRDGPALRGEERIGQRIRCRVVKNKIAPPFQEATVELLDGGARLADV